MARPQKEGLAYFSLDVDFFSDRKVKILKGRFGADGITYYLYLLCEIYKGHGYYLEVDEDFDYITSSELGMSHAKIGQMRKFLLERSLFDNKLFQSDTILTSTSIQRRFQLAVKSRASKNPVVVNPKFWLLSKEETQSFIKMHPILNNSEKKPDYSQKNPEDSENNAIKKRKENVVVVVVKEREEILQCFEQNIAVATVAVKKKMDAYLQKLSPELMQAAIEYSALMGAKGWRYVQAVLDSCIERGIATPQEFEEKCRRHSRSPKAAEDRAAAQNKAAPDKRSYLSSQPSPPARSGDGSESSIDFEAIRQYMTHGSTDQTLCSS